MISPVSVSQAFHGASSGPGFRGRVQDRSVVRGSVELSFCSVLLSPYSFSHWESLPFYASGSPVSHSPPGVLHSLDYSPLRYAYWRQLVAGGGTRRPPLRLSRPVGPRDVTIRCHILPLQHNNNRKTYNNNGCLAASLLDPQGLVSQTNRGWDGRGVTWWTEADSVWW